MYSPKCIYTPKAKLIRVCIFAAAVALLLQTGCGTKEGVFRLTEDRVSIQAERSEINSTDGTIKLLKTQYTLPQLKDQESIDTIITSYANDLLLIKTTMPYNTATYRSFMHYYMIDSRTDSLLWQAEGNVKPQILNKGYIALDHGKSIKLYEAKSAALIRKLESNSFHSLSTDTGAYLYDKMMRISEESFALSDIQSGKTIWDVKGHEWAGYSRMFCDSEYIYVIAEGLHVIKIADGTKWEYLTSTSNTDYTKAVAQAVAAGCIAGLLSGGTMVYTGNSQPDMVHNMNARPLRIGNKIYFAARDKLTCHDISSGQIIWQAKIEPELEGMELLRLSDDEIVLIGTGKKFMNFTLQPSDNPKARIFNAASGDLKGSYETPKDKKDFVQDVIIRNNEILMLTSDFLYVLDAKLKLVSIISASREYGAFLRLLKSDSQILIRSGNGVIALDKDSFKEKWFWYSSLPPTAEPDSWIGPIVLRNTAISQGLQLDDIYYCARENGKFIGLDLRTGKEILQTDATARLYRLESDNFVTIDQNKIKIFKIARTEVKKGN